jgi:hypothetical protein
MGWLVDLYRPTRAIRISEYCGMTCDFRSTTRVRLLFDVGSAVLGPSGARVFGGALLSYALGIGFGHSSVGHGAAVAATPTSCL